MKESPCIFFDPCLDVEFKKKGFVIIPFLAEVEVRECLKFYRKNHPVISRGFRPTFSFSNEAIQKVSAFLEPIFSRKVKELLISHQYLVGTYYTKPAGDPTSSLGMHQDWTVVDEKCHASINIWCPLVRTHLNNGPLELVPSSHLVGFTIRGQGVPSPISKISERLYKDFGEVIYSSPGEAVIYDGRLIHGSPRANLTPEARIAAACSLVPRGAQLLHYFSVRKDWLEIFELTSDFYTSVFQEGRYPREMKRIQVLHHLQRQLDNEDLIRIGWFEKAIAARNC